MSVLPLNLPEIHTLIFSTIFLKTTKYVVYNYGHRYPKFIIEKKFQRLLGISKKLKV